MKCVIPGANVKILARAIHALSRIGDEMYIEPQKDVLSFRTVNIANSAYADFTFFQSYFSYYIYGDLQENDALKCKISMRVIRNYYISCNSINCNIFILQSAVTVFKAPNLIDKQVETCHIRLESDASEILFILKYKNSITKTHLLPILDCEILQTTYNKDSASVKLTSQPRVLGDALHNFHQQLIEITLEVAAQKLLLRNYVDDASGLSNTTRTQLAFGKGEFDRYDIGSETSITFCMKEFKSILNFAEIINIPVSIYFEGAGRIKNKSPKSNNSLENVILKKTQSCVLKEQKQENDFKEQANLSINVVSTSEEDNQNLNKVSNFPTQRNHEEESQKDSLHSGDIITKFNKTSISGKKLINCVFSNITKRKSSSNKTDREKSLNNDKSDLLEDEIVNSSPPPIKKARLIFQKCFQTTFDPNTLPGYDKILAEDSDEACSE
ncbi:Cell cycle checkpoint control protein RAD9A [Eufriesea mexicana]|uniref:Cell cycle checkpoint control protein RAD9A n=1 Tax=Eufriesea mexicana TaxID=516756 RepID=A0A310SK19_9HYME|nr:Cell cycle checkpoint control protein RAD9A [Eufriesea mexicana]